MDGMGGASRRDFHVTSVASLLFRFPPNIYAATVYILCRAALCVCLRLCVFVCVLSSRCLVCRPSHLCVCRVGTPPAR